MANWCMNTIFIKGPSEDVSVLYKSLKEYKDEVDAKVKETDEDRVDIGTWIKSKFSDKLPEFTEDDYKLSYSNFIVKNYLCEVYDDQAYISIYSESKMDSRMYALVKLIENAFPKCIIHYISEEPGMNYYINTDESGHYFPEKWYYISRFKSKSDYCVSEKDMYSKLITDYADIIKYNNIVIPALVNPEASMIHELVNSLVEYDEDLSVHQYTIGPEYVDKKVDNIESVGG